jgi:hypothetical protein
MNTKRYTPAAPVTSEAKRFNHILRTTERVRLLDALATGITEWGLDQGLFRSCLNCEHWTGENPTNAPPEQCRKFRARPPARVIVTGCDDHTDLIPF